jgi:hypothetical protein
VEGPGRGDRRQPGAAVGAAASPLAVSPTSSR